jgi:hypothetical protein
MEVGSSPTKLAGNNDGVSNVGSVVAAAASIQRVSGVATNAPSVHTHDGSSSGQPPTEAAVVGIAKSCGQDPAPPRTSSVESQPLLDSDDGAAVIALASLLRGPTAGGPMLESETSATIVPDTRLMQARGAPRSSASSSPSLSAMPATSVNATLSAKALGKRRMSTTSSDGTHGGFANKSAARLCQYNGGGHCMKAARRGSGATLPSCIAHGELLVACQPQGSIIVLIMIIYLLL